ncbi:hypothetical protein EsH8_VII_000448 [Colletotrichum jinshuiense]
MADPKNYTVGWICAIKTEFVAAQVLLDEKHDPPEYIAERDNNSYALGRIHKHNVAIAVLPDGEYGLSQATAVARDMLHTFPNIRIGLMVGIGGGAPTSKNDIRLGDVVVSAPRNGYSGVFEYDFGKTIQERNFQYTKHLDQPPVAIRAAVASLQADYECNGHNIRETINKIIEKNKRLRKYARPDISTDLLYRSEVIHPADSGACMEACGVDPRKIIPRKQRDEDEGDDDPTIHYGLIASANQLMKDATVRDHLATERGVLCFEMEAAGLMNHFPCLVIRGICDYSDTHKNDNWHGYASMTAAVYAADILRRIHPSRVEAEKKIAEVIESVKEFPTSDRLQMKLRQKMEVSSSRAFLAKICVAYLSQINEEMTKTDIEEAFSFAKYSAQSWIGHAAARPPVKNAEIDTLILNLFLFNKVAYENWYRVLSPDVFCAEPLDSGVIYVASCRYYACFYGMTVDVEALLSYSVDVNEWGGQYHYALLAAAVRGHERIGLANGLRFDLHLKQDMKWSIDFCLALAQK